MVFLAEHAAAKTSVQRRVAEPRPEILAVPAIHIPSRPKSKNRGHAGEACSRYPVKSPKAPDPEVGANIRAAHSRAPQKPIRRKHFQEPRPSNARRQVVWS